MCNHHNLRLFDAERRKSHQRSGLFVRMWRVYGKRMCVAQARVWDKRVCVVRACGCHLRVLVCLPAHMSREKLYITCLLISLLPSSVAFVCSYVNNVF